MQSLDSGCERWIPASWARDWRWLPVETDSSWADGGAPAAVAAAEP